MDAYEATRIVFSRIQALDPENAAKIMGLLLIQDHGEKEMIRLAFGPETLLHSLILKAKKELGILSPTAPASPFAMSRQNSLSRNNTTLPLQFSRSNSMNEELVENEYLLQEQLSFLNEQDGLMNGFGWKPCLYYARGFCKNGSSCRFLHGPVDDMYATSVEQQCQELMLMRSKSQRFAASASFPYSPAGSSSSRAAAMALMLENENNKFMGRARMERSDFAGIVNPSSRQIYLTFPADSTFREEDVSNYFSIYGPVQDVRIPYQQKRMFGFVTFVYPETVKLILAKGNPHFVCDARVLVKPYKEKGKVPDKYGKLQQGERFDFSGPPTPTGFDSRDPFDLQQLANARMMYNNGSNNQDILLRRKLEEQQAAAELQQAIEMQGRRFMGLQLLDIKNRSFSSSATAPNAFNAAVFSDGSKSSNASQENDVAGVEEKSLSPSFAALSKQQTSVNSDEAAPNEDFNYQESAEHNLPDSPFASPTKNSSFVVNEENALNNFNNGSGHLINSTLLTPTSPLDNMASFKSCFFEMPRFSSGHGAVGL